MTENLFKKIPIFNRLNRLSVYTTGLIKYRPAAMLFMLLALPFMTKAQLIEKWKVTLDGRSDYDVPSGGLGMPDGERRNIGMDAEGNVYITTFTQIIPTITIDPTAPPVTPKITLYLTKYNPAGQLIWEKSYSELINNQEAIHGSVSIKVDKAGNSTIAAISQLVDNTAPVSAPRQMYSTVLRYDKDGKQTWVYTYDLGKGEMGPQLYNLEVDPDGNTYFYGTKNEQQAPAIPGETGDENPFITTAIPNLITTTTTYRTTYLVKLDNFGSKKWEKLVPYTNGAPVIASVVKVSSDGNIYTVESIIPNGSTNPTNPTMPPATNFPYDNIIRKYDASGEQLWQQSYAPANNTSSPSQSPGPITQFSALTGVILDAAGNMYTVTAKAGLNGLPSMLLTKFDPAGQMSWEKIVDIDESAPEIANKIYLDKEGNIYLLGTAMSTTSSMFTAKLDPTGTIIWKVKNEMGMMAIPGDVTVSSKGNVYVVATTMSMPTTPTSGPLGVTRFLKYNKDGEEKWKIDIQPSSTSTIPTIPMPGKLLLDPEEHIYVKTGGYVTGLPQITRFEQKVPVKITSEESDPTKTGEFTVKIEFGEQVEGFTSDDISVENATFSDFSGDGKTYTVKLSPKETGEVKLTFAVDKAFNDELFGNAEGKFSIQYDITPPANPVNLAVEAGDSENILTWDANTETDLKEYWIYAGTAPKPGDLIRKIAAGTTTYTHTNLSNGTDYYYYIVAVDKLENSSSASEEKSAKPQAAQSITFEAIAEKTYGDANFSPAASASSGLDVTFSSNNESVAKIDQDGKVQIVGAGQATITASQAGSPLYLPAKTKDQTLVVKKKQLTVSLKGKVSKTYDGNTNANPTSENYTLDGVVPGETVSLNAPESAYYSSVNAGTSIDVNLYGLSIAEENKSNYELKSTQAYGAVGEIKAKEVTASLKGSVRKTYDGNTVATLTADNYELTGMVQVQTVTLVSVPTTIPNTIPNTVSDNSGRETNLVVPPSTVGLNNPQSGSYDTKDKGAKLVTVSGLELTGNTAGNYVLKETTISGEVGQIDAKEVTASFKADPLIKVYDGSTDAGASASDLYKLSGVIGQDEVTVSGTASFDNKNVGSNRIVTANDFVLSGSQKDNYKLKSLTATTTGIIARKTLTVKADNKTRYQGIANPALTVSYTGFVTGESENNLITKALASTTATISSNAGPYVISVSGASANNYDFDYVAGTLTITPGYPTSVSLAATTLYENAPAGTVAGTLSSTSEDPSATFTYSLVTGDEWFVINGNQIRTKDPLNFETKSVYSVVVKSTTQHGLSLDKELSISLANVNEQPTLDAIANSSVCATTAEQAIALSGITAGEDANQNTTVSVIATNNAMFKSIQVSQAVNGNAMLKYRLMEGSVGSSVINITVSDNGGTENGGVNTIMKSFVVNVYALPVISITSDKGLSVSKGDVAVLKAEISGGNTGLNYSWSDANGITSLAKNQSTLEVRPTETTTYNLTVTNENGCESTQSITIEVLADFKMVSGTNIITPNGDGVNDNFVIRNIDMYPNNVVKIFDRAGRLLYSKTNYNNEFNGTFQGSPLAEDTYYYVVDFGNKSQLLKGFITIVRD